MAIIPKHFMDAVVAIGVASNSPNCTWIGTGFLVGRKEENNPQMSTIYLITNFHVVKNKREIYVKFNSNATSITKDYCVPLFHNDNPDYSRHPTSDIVAMQINPKTLINDDSVFGFFDLDNNSLTLSQMQETGVEEGTLVYALGFPMNLVTEGKKTPICRLGCISRISDVFVDNSIDSFLVDAQTFPGNSGGPIISRPEAFSIKGTSSNSSANLIGILHSYIPYRDTLISQQTGEARSILAENSGITNVHPVDRIKDVVELEWQRKTNPQARRV